MLSVALHALVGALIALALRVRARHVPLAVALALVPAADAFVPGLEGRLLHNVFVTIALPLGVYAVLRWREAPVAWRRLALAAPTLLVGHVLVDVVPLARDAERGQAALFWPVSDAWFGLAFFQYRGMDPRDFSSFTVLIVLLSALLVLTALALWILEPAPGASRPRRFERAGPFALAAFALAWLVLFPSLAAGGALVTGPALVHADVTLTDATLHVVDARFTAHVTHAGGEPAPAGSLLLELVTRSGAHLVLGSNPAPLASGASWRVDARASVPWADLDGVQARVRMNSDLQPVPFAAARVSVDKAWLAGPVRVTAFEHDARDTGFVTVENAGRATVPAGALRVIVSDGTGRVLADVANPDALVAGASARVPLPLPRDVVTEPHALVVRADAWPVTFSESTRAATPNPAAGSGVPPVPGALPLPGT